MSLGNKIVKIRKDNNMSQEVLAQMFHVTRQTVSSWENSKSYPDIETLIKISDEFNISLDVLLKEDKKMVKNIDKKLKSTKIKNIIMVCFALLIVILISIIGIKFYNDYVDKYNDEIKKYASKEAIGYININNQDVRFKAEFDFQGKVLNDEQMAKVPVNKIYIISGNKDLFQKLDIDVNKYIGKQYEEFEHDLTYALFEKYNVRSHNSSYDYKTLGEVKNLKSKKHIGR